MKGKDFDHQTNEFMLYCRSTQLQDRTMYSYKKTLRRRDRSLRRFGYFAKVSGRA